MSVYVDALQWCEQSAGWPWDRVSHLMADSETELHIFAERLGLKRGWFQGPRPDRWMPGIPHYDLTPGKRQAALRLGAMDMTTMGVASVARKLGELREAAGCRVEAGGRNSKNTDGE